ncbi:MAG: DUF4177 domain-containing protein [Isosphaeraceae bacterium]
MPYIACPSCGERGKIPPTLVGARIKCRKCGISFNVAPSAAKAQAAAGAQAMAHESGGAPPDGIVVEGLDATAWTVSNDQPGDLLKVEAEAEHGTSDGHDAGHVFEAHGSARKEYKIICSRDKIFEGKFELARLEEVINLYARQGWVVRGMSTPHLKGFGEGTKEEIVILLER